MRSTEKNKGLITALIALAVSLLAGLMLCACDGVQPEPQPQPKPQPSIYTLTYIAGENGNIAGSAEQTVESGQSGAAVVAVPDDGYAFVKWSDGVTTAARTDKNVTKNISVAAEFKKKETPPAPDNTPTYALVYLKNIDEAGIIVGFTPQTVKKGESGCKVTAVAYTGYVFVKWSDGVTTAERTDTNVTKNIVVTAEFKKTETPPVFYYNVSYSAGAGGSISGKTTQRVESRNNAESVTAVPDEGYIFVKWSDGVTTAERTDANVTKNINVTAEFKKKETPLVVYYNVSYGAGTGGSISGETAQRVESGKNAQTVTAVPNEGYEFVKWSDGVTTAERTDTNVTKNIVVTAEFRWKSDLSADGSLRFSLVNSGAGCSVAANDKRSVRAIIPAAFCGIPITEIADSAFSGCAQLKEIYIPTTVKSIGDGAFADCSELDNITLPASLTYVGDKIFRGYVNTVYVEMTEAEMNALNANWKAGIGENAVIIYLPIVEANFNLSLINNSTEYKVTARNKGMTVAKIPRYYKGLPVSEISDSGFTDCDSLVTVNIPDTVKRIGNNAFANCDGLVTINIPDSVISIGSNAFRLCNNLASITGMRAVQYMGSGVFTDCPELDNIVLPATLTYVGNAILRNYVNTVYVEMTEAEMNAINAYWKDGMPDASKQIIYLG